MLVARPVQQSETATAQSRRMGFHYRQHCRHSHGGIEGIAAALEHLMAGGGGQRMRRGDGRGSSVLRTLRSDGDAPTRKKRRGQ